MNGVLNLVIGRGSQNCDVLVEHPAVVLADVIFMLPPSYSSGCVSVCWMEMHGHQVE
jgi:hypothetical protein